MNRIIYGDNLEILSSVPSKTIRLVYIDPQFNTGKPQKRGELSYSDKFTDFDSFLIPRIASSLRCLTVDGSLLIHLDYREVHYIKVAMDRLLGRDHFMNEIIWAYDYGGRSKTKWSAKHDTILWYVLDTKNYVFNFEEMDRIPYMAPGLVGPEKAAKGKTPTDVHWHTIVPTNGIEKTGYPTQKPIGLLDRFVKVHSNPGDVCLDFFAGSGSFGYSAARNGRKFILIDNNPDAIQIMAKRLALWSPTVILRKDNDETMGLGPDDVAPTGIAVD